MRTTRKKVNKPVYKDENDSEQESVGDFSDSGSEAEIPEAEVTSSDEEFISDDAFQESAKKTASKPNRPKKTKFVKEFYKKINKQSSAGDEDAVPAAPAFSVRDLTEEDKLLPSFLNLSESDSSDDETPKAPVKKAPAAEPSSGYNQDSDGETSQAEYKDVWSQNLQDNSEEVAKKTFMELEQQKAKIEETKASIMKYKGSEVKHEVESAKDVKDLLALGEEFIPQQSTVRKIRKTKKAKDDSDSDVEDWEEVKDAKSIPQQGLQLVVDFPDVQCRKSKKIDIEMMMKRKINRVKKEYQVYMHKVHVLCWLGHGNYVSRILNDQEIFAAALSLIPSKECYPGERVDMKYLEQITTWYKDKLILKQDKNEEKFKPKAPPLNEILKAQIKSRVVTAKKYLVFVFVSMLRALGLQCRIMFNFTTLPIKPPSTELCSLSTKTKEDKSKTDTQEKPKEAKTQSKKKNASKTKNTVSQIDGNDDSIYSDDTDYDDILQLDGNDDKSVKTRSIRTTRKATNVGDAKEDVSPPKRARRNPSSKDVNTTANGIANTNTQEQRKTNRGKANDNKETKALDTDPTKSSTNTRQTKRGNKTINNAEKMEVDIKDDQGNIVSKQTSKTSTTKKSTRSVKSNQLNDKNIRPPEIVITSENNESDVSSKYFENTKPTVKKLSLTRNRSTTANPSTSQKNDNVAEKQVKAKTRTKSAPGSSVEKSEYFEGSAIKSPEVKRGRYTRAKEAEEDKQRISHRDVLVKNKAKPKNDVTGDLVDIIKKRVKEAKENSKRGKVKAKTKDSDHDSDYLPEEEPKNQKFDSDDEFKPTNSKISPRPSTSKTTKKIDRRVLSSDSEELSSNKCNFWCEVFVEELEQWIAVDVIRAKVHCTNELYNRATHPVCYVVGWDNNNYLKDLTRRYVPQWNTVTRKQRVEPIWWQTAIKPWLGPKTARDREEDEQLDRMQMDAPLPKSIAEYKNHPLYALKRHLLKFEAIYPPDAATLGFVRNEAVYSRDCVYVCRSRDTWLKEAKVVRLGEQPYKVVKARPKWDKLSNKLITDKPLEVFGPWQVSDYEPPVAENGVVPRNAYGNVELFKDCMLPKGTVHLKLPGLNRVAKKLNIDCAPAMTGFDFNGGWSHPVYDGFVVCKEFEEIITDAWVKDKEEQERRELEKLEARVYGNWKRLIKGLLIRERLKNKYGFEEPQQPDTKKKGPKLVVKKK